MPDLRSPAVRRLVRAAFAAYLVVLAAAVFTRLGGIGFGEGVAVNLTLSRPDLLGSWESQRNVLMTIPLGVMLPLVVRWRYEAYVLVAAAAPLAIETGQLVGSLVLGRAWRAFDVDDLLLNTVGGLLGLALTGAALALHHRVRRGEPPALPAPRRLVPGALAAALVAWTVGSTLTTPDDVVMVWACDAPPRGAVTSLPGGAEVYAGPDGGLCVRTPDGGSSSLPPDAQPGLVSRYEADGAVYDVGVTLPDAPGGDGSALYPIDGADLLVWESAA